MVERYHDPVRRSYLIIRDELPHLSKQASLKMAFKAINDTAGPKGLVPTLLVFGAYSKICNLDAPAVSIEQRAKAYRKAMEEVRKLRADRQIKDALGMRNGPTTSAVRDLPPQSQVLVWREGNSGKKGSWEGPYILVGIDENTCNVKLHENSDKPSAFRITSVKPYFSNSEGKTTDKSLAAQGDGNSTSTIHQKEDVYPRRIQPKRSAGRPNRYTMYFQNEPVFETYLQNDLPRDGFKTSRIIECRGIVNRKVTSHVAKDRIPPGTHIYKAKFIDEIKNKNSNDWFEKSRMCIAAWGDKEKWTVLTQSPTIQRASQ
ncbi:hypothetical protein EPUL_006437, partial [Erysiphe pulchra]